MRRMAVRRLTILLLPALIAACAGVPPIGTEGLRVDVGYLASDAMQGRMTGSAGERLAAAYIEERFREAGLEPAFGDSFRQPFEFNAGSAPLPGSSVRKGELHGAVQPLGFSKNGTAQGSLCYLGYGVAGNDRDDYEGIDVTGTVVVVDRQAADDVEAAERRELAPFLSARHRAWLAERRGAVGILFVASGSEGGHRKNGVARGKQTGIVAATVDRSELEKLSGPIENLAPRAPHPLAMPSCTTSPVEIDVRLKQETGFGQNVVGILRANAGRPAKATIVVGAHYDHLGLGEVGSLMEGATGTVHNGADDNASGTSAVIALAQAAGNFQHRSHDIVFAAFSGEEIGLVGSSEFASRWFANRKRPQIAAMINFDMIGRLDDALIIQGVGSSSQWPRIVRSAARRARFGVELRLTQSAYLPTDAMSFYLKKVPVLNFFSGAHAEYHKPGDDAELINYDGMARTIELACALLERIAKSAPPPYTAASTPERRTGPGVLQVYLGTIPDYSGKESDGLVLTGVRDGSPAAAGGLRAGDVILRIDDTEITDVYTYTYFLSGVRPGQTLSVLIERNGEQHTLIVVPESR